MKSREETIQEMDRESLIKELEAAEFALRDIAMFLSCGGFNSQEFDAEKFRFKIKDAIGVEIKTAFNIGRYELPQT